MVHGARFRRERLAEAASDEMIAATDLADLLVKRGVPFRESHGVVAGLVRTAVDSGRSLSQLSADELRAASAHLDHASGRTRKPNSLEDHRTISAPSRDRCVAHVAAALR